jgi:hypothetical protein
MKTLKMVLEKNSEIKIPYRRNIAELDWRRERHLKLIDELLLSLRVRVIRQFLQQNEKLFVLPGPKIVRIMSTKFQFNKNY